MPNAMQPTPPPLPIPQPEKSGQGAANFNPAPSHAEAVTTLRHCQTVGSALHSLLKNPDLGKSDMRSAVINATTKLVAQRVMPATQAVTVLGQLPDRPYDQRKWLEQMYVQNMGAQIAILQHHRDNSAGSGDWAQEAMQHSDTSGDHMSTMQNMMQSHYGMR